MQNDQQILYLNPRDLLPSRENVRSDPGSLAGLAETIREHGILQPLGVAPEGQAYRVVYGNRRRDAAIVVGLDRVPCVTVQSADPQSVMVQQVLENLQRLDLNDMDKSRAFDRMLQHLAQQGAPQSQALDQMARTLGLSARQIQRYLRLAQLAPAVRQHVASGAIGVTHAQHLVDITPDARQEAVAELVIEESLSAAELARLCAALERNANVAPAAALELLRRGERVPVIESRPVEQVSHLAPEPMTQGGAARDWDGDAGDAPPPPWDAPDQQDGFTPSRDDRDYGALEPTTQDGNRIRKFHSLDAFVDEVQRLTRCLQEGDLQRLLEQDEASRLKIGLAARQLRFLAEAVGALAQAEG
jgi:ParB family chromosome partitioning protein